MDGEPIGATGARSGEVVPDRESEVAPVEAGGARASAVFLFEIATRRDGSLMVRGVAANAPARDLAGLDTSHTLSVPLDGLFAATSALAVLRHLQDVVASGEARRAAVRLVARGGEVAGDASFTPLIDEAGVVASVVMVAPGGGQAQAGERDAVRVSTGSNPVGLFRAEPGLGNVFVSDEMAEILGIAAEEALGRGWLDVVHPEDRAAVEDAVERALQQAQTLDLEYRFRRPDGAERRACLRAAPLLGDSGAVSGFVGTVEDVTDVRELQRAATRFATTIDATSDIVTYHDHTGRVVYMNVAARGFFGIGEADPLPEMYPPDMAAPVPEGTPVIYEALEADGQWRGEMTMIGAGGRRMLASVVIVGHRDGEGRVEYFAGVARDVTEQREAEAARRRSEATLRAIVQHSPLGIQVLDEQARVQLWNPACERIYGWTAEEVLGKPVPFLSQEKVEEFESRRRRVLAGETIDGYEVRRSRKDGSMVHVSVFVAPLRDARGRVMASVAVVNDVTRRVEAETALREREQLMRALVESASDIISIVDADGTIRYSSRVSERVLGYAEGSAPGLKIFDIVHPDEVDDVRELWEERLGTPGFVRPIEVRLLRADGTWLQAEVVGNSLLDDPAVQGVVLTTRDISERKAAEEALSRRDERFRALMQNLAEAIVVLDRDAGIIFNTPTAAKMFGDPDPDGTGSNATLQFERLHPEDRPRVEAAFAEVWASPGTVGPVETRVRHADGHWVRVEAFAQNLFDDPAVEGIVITMHHVTERKRAEELNVRQAEILELVARGVPLEDTLDAIARALEEHDPGLHCVVYLLDPDGVTLRPRAAPSLPEAFVRAMDGVQAGPNGLLLATAGAGRGPICVTDIESDERWADYRPLALDHGFRSCWSTALLSSGTGETLGAFVVYAGYADMPSVLQEQLVGMGAHLAAIAIERKRFEERLSHQSLHDPLTALPNRVLFLDRLGHGLERCRRTRSEVAVLFLDLDRFKLINDSLGHDAGDELLVATAQRLTSAVRPGDTVARFGGDEFTVLCEDLPTAAARERATEIAERLFAAIAKPYVLNGSEIFLSASIGIAIAVDTETRPEDLLRDADAAMYHAKEQGKGRWELFDEEMRERALSRHATENALHRAIERGELRLFFQPVISLADHRCVGAEALVRWQHPDRGLVLPGEFISLAEETGLILDLGRWVFEEAAHQAARWQVEAPDDFVVSVNISARQLVQPDIVEVLSEILQRTGVRPRHICLEITESVLMDDAAATLSVIERVRDLGVRFSIDDFGTGYSSLGYLKRFPVDAVKIDRSFVSGVDTDAGDAAIVSAVVGLAHALNLQVVAEGVETPAQLAELSVLGCDHAQGYFFAPPQPVGDLGRIFARNRWRTPDSAARPRRRPPAV